MEMIETQERARGNSMMPMPFSDNGEMVLVDDGFEEHQKAVENLDSYLVAEADSFANHNRIKDAVTRKNAKLKHLGRIKQKNQRIKVVMFVNGYVARNNFDGGTFDAEDLELATATDNLFGKKARARRKARKTKRKAKKVGRQDKRAGRKAKRKAKKIIRKDRRAKHGGLFKATAKRTALAPLFPFKGLMKNSLRKGGFAAPNDMLDLTEAFYNNIVKKSSSYEGDDLSSSLETTRHLGDDSDHFAGAISGVVAAVLSFIKKLIAKNKEKKQAQEIQARSGQKMSIPKMSGVESFIANSASNVLTQIKQKQKGTEPLLTVGVEGGINTKTMMLIGGGIAALIAVIFIVKK